MQRLSLLSLVVVFCLASMPALAVPLGSPLPADGVVALSAPVAGAVPAVVAPAVVPQPDDVAAFASAVIAAFSAKNYGLLAAFGLILLVWLGRKFGGKVWPFLSTDRGGALLSLVGGLGLSIAAAATAPGATGIGSVLLSGLLMTVTASGTYAVLRKLLFPSGADLAQEADATQGADEAGRAKDAASVADRVNAGLGR